MAEALIDTTKYTVEKYSKHPDFKYFINHYLESNRCDFGNFYFCDKKLAIQALKQRGMIEADIYEFFTSSEYKKAYESQDTKKVSQLTHDFKDRFSRSDFNKIVYTMLNTYFWDIDYFSNWGISNQGKSSIDSPYSFFIKSRNAFDKPKTTEVASN